MRTKRSLNCSRASGALHILRAAARTLPPPYAHHPLVTPSPHVASSMLCRAGACQYSCAPCLPLARLVARRKAVCTRRYHSLFQWTGGRSHFVWCPVRQATQGASVATLHGYLHGTMPQRPRPV
eukprot:scaffold304748_cov40-Tisochrysis_lutea.AAC.1